MWETFHHQRCVLSVAACSLDDGPGSRSDVSIFYSSSYNLILRVSLVLSIVQRVHVCLPFMSASLRYTLLFSAATDGKIAVWDLTEACSVSKNTPLPSIPCLNIPAHQSGVNSLAVWVDKQGSGCQVTVASGGDDGQLTVSVIRVQYPKETTAGGSREPSQISASLSPPQRPSSLRFHLNSQHHVPTAHAAPLTSLKLLRPGVVVSTSADQRVCLWKVGRAGVRQIGSLCSHVADAAGLAVWEEEEEEDEGQDLGDGIRKTGFDEQQNPMWEGRSSETRRKNEPEKADTEAGGPLHEGPEEGSNETSDPADEGAGKAGWVLVCGQGFQLLHVRDPEKRERQPS